MDFQEKTWDLLLEDIRTIKENQNAMARDIETIKNKIAWISGVATAITLAINIAWQLLSRIKV